jgi:hypothetical protein
MNYFKRANICNCSAKKKKKNKNNSPCQFEFEIKHIIVSIKTVN